MSFLKSLFRSLAITAAAGVIVEGVRQLHDGFGTVAVLKIRDGRVSVEKGFFSPGAKDGVKRIVAELALRNGSIAIRNNGRVVYSAEFPPAVHQRLTNIIRNA